VGHFAHASLLAYIGAEHTLHALPFCETLPGAHAAFVMPLHAWPAGHAVQA